MFHVEFIGEISRYVRKQSGSIHPSGDVIPDGDGYRKPEATYAQVCNLWAARYATIAVLVRYIHTMSAAAERMMERNDVYSRLTGLKKKAIIQ